MRAAASDADALDILGREPFDLLVLDAILPDLDARDLCRRAKVVTEVPVLVITSLTAEANILDHFQAGADDVLRKPFGMREFAARATALLRRVPPADGAGCASVLCNAALRVDLSRHATTRGVQSLSLTPTEFRLLT